MLRASSASEELARMVVSMIATGVGTSRAEPATRAEVARLHTDLAALGCRLSAELQHILLYSNDGSAVPVMRTAQRGTTMKWRLPQLAHVVLAGAGPFRAELIARAVGLPGLEAHQRTLVRGEVVRDLGAQAVREVQ